MQNAITEGVIWKQLLFFFFPIVLGTFFQQLYNTADAIIVGKFVGKEALAAVGGTTGTLINLLVGFFVGLSSGASVIISQFYGAQRSEDVSRAVHTTMALALASGAALTVLGICLSKNVLIMMGTPADVLDYAVTYINIYFLGMIPSLIYNIGSGILRAVGDSRRPLFFLVSATMTNIVLDVVLVIGLNLGVAGAAAATVLSQVVSAVLVMMTLCRTSQVYRLQLKKIRFYGDMLVRIVRIGLPAGLQSVMYSLSNIIIQASMNVFGTDVLAAWTAYGKLSDLYWMIISAFGIAITTFTGQNFGAGKYDRIRQGTYACLLLGIIYCAIYIVIARFGTQYLVLLFMNADEAQSVLDYTQRISYAYAYGTPLLLGVNVFRLSIQGMGYSRLSLISGLLEMIARTAVGIWGVPQFGFAAACLASPLAWALADCFLIPAYYGCLNARRRLAARVRKELPTE